jgi:predicted chitinase
MGAARRRGHHRGPIPVEAAMLTEDQLRRIVPKMRADRVTEFTPHLNAAMAAFSIDSPLRTAAFVAQLAHESGSFVWMKELWGPTEAQRRYEPPSDLARRLGNTQPGDGKRYMGRGPIQLTGRDNYRRFGAALGLDLEGEPDQAATPAVGFRIAGLYWKNRDINTPADAGDIREVTRRINGGFNGLADRTDHYERAKAVLAEGFVPNPVARGGARSAPVPAEPLELGREPGAAPVWAEAPAKKVAAKKTPAKKAAAKKAPAKKPAAKKTPAARKKPAAKG